MKSLILFFLQYLGPAVVGWLIYKGTGNIYLGWAAGIFQFCIGTLVLVGAMSSLTGSILEIAAGASLNDRRRGG